MHIDDYRFGRITIEATDYHRDLRIAAGRVLPDWWRRTGHTCTLEDLEDLLDPLLEIVLLGQGNPGLMRADDRLRHFLADHNVELIEEPTPRAIHTFNRLTAAGRRVVAGFHLTC